MAVAPHTCADVVVDIVGKYVYSIESPNGEMSVPLIVDVDLVGRTKVGGAACGFRCGVHTHRSWIG